MEVSGCFKAASIVCWQADSTGGGAAATYLVLVAKGGKEGVL